MKSRPSQTDSEDITFIGFPMCDIISLALDGKEIDYIGEIKIGHKTSTRYIQNPLHSVKFQKD